MNCDIKTGFEWQHIVEYACNGKVIQWQEGTVHREGFQKEKDEMVRMQMVTKSLSSLLSKRKMCFFIIYCSVIAPI